MHLTHRQCRGLHILLGHCQTENVYTLDALHDSVPGGRVDGVAVLEQCDESHCLQSAKRERQNAAEYADILLAHGVQVMTDSAPSLAYAA